MEAEFCHEPLRSSKEENELGLSVKKFKESSVARQFTPPQTLVSYKDSLVGDIPRAYEQTFNLDNVWDDGEESDTEVKPLVEELSIEFYDMELLKEIGSAIGPILWIDSYTATGSRGSFARLCIQIRVALTDTLGWCYVELGKAWKNIFSFNSSMHQNEKSPFGSSSLGSNSQPLVEVHHRFTTPVLGGGQSSEQVVKAICSALL
nr:hypothetical protein CFP56_28406 [Quercus suber]